MRMRTMLFAAVIFLLILGAAGPASALYQIGDHVDNFTLPNASGQQVSLYDYQDCIIVMPFWFAT